MNTPQNTHPTLSAAKPELHANTHKSIADLLVDYLEQLSVKYVFGVPGGPIEGFYDAMARSQRRGGLRPILARHETGAAFMAEGYYRATGTLGVCCATTGPGATNLVTGVASAYENNIPMLVITAQTALAHFGRDAWQESSCTGINTVGIFQFCTHYNTLVSHVAQFEHKLASAIMAAFRLPQGPAHLSIPRDLLKCPALVAAPQYDLAGFLRFNCLSDTVAIDQLLSEVKNAKNIILMLGPGCAEAVGMIIKVADLLGARIVSEAQGRGLLSSYHPLFCGVIGFGGHDSALAVLNDPEVDIVLVIGSNLGELASNNWDKSALLHNRLIHIDANEEHFGNSLMARLQVRGNIHHIFEYLYQNLVDSMPEAKTNAIQAVLPFRLNDEESYRSDRTPIKPQSLMRELAERFPPDTLFLSDTGNSTAWAIHYLHPKTIGYQGNFYSCLEFAAMGWAIGAAIGFALAMPGKPIVGIVGDGSLLMNGQEISVAVHEKLTVIFVVLNDSALGMVKHGQRLSGAERISYEIPKTDFSAMAKAMGADGYTIKSARDLMALDMNRLCNKKGPSLLDVHVDPEEIPPIGLRISSRKNQTL